MDIINVTTSSVKAKMDRASFEMNMILNDPTKENAVDLFQGALKIFTECKAQIAVIENVSGQIEEYRNQLDETKNNTPDN